MNWQDKYENFAEFEKSPDYKIWLEEKMANAPLMKAYDRQKTPEEIEREKYEKMCQEELDKLEEEAKNKKDPSDLFEVRNEETGEINLMTRQEYENTYGEIDDKE